MYIALPAFAGYGGVSCGLGVEHGGGLSPAMHTCCILGLLDNVTLLMVD